MKRLAPIFILLLALTLSAHAQFGKTIAFKAASVPPPAAGGGGGGGFSGTCPADGSPTLSQAGTATAAVKIMSDEPYAGQMLTMPNMTNLCKVRVRLSAAINLTGTNFFVKVFAVSAGSINPASPVGTSDTVAGNTSWAGTDVIFPFSTHVVMTGGVQYVVVVTSSAGTTGVATTYKNTAGSLTGDYVWIHANGVIVNVGDGSDWICGFYFEQ